LGTTILNITGANNKLVMGDSTSDTQSWGTTVVTTSSSVVTVKSTANAGAVTLRGGGGTLDVLGVFNATVIAFGDASNNYGVLKLSGGSAFFTGAGSSFAVTGTGNKIIGGAASYGNLTLAPTSAVAYTSNITLGGAGTYENNFNLIKSGIGTLTLNGTNTYTGTTTVSGGTLKLDFTNSATNIISSSSALVLGGGTLSLAGKASTTNDQTVNGTTLNAGASAITLGNATSNPLALTLGTVTRNVGGTVAFTNPGGTLSATNGIQTNTGVASTILTVSGVAYATLGTTDWAAKDSTSAWIVGLSSIGGAYTAANATALGGNADLSAAGNTTLATGASITSLRFSQASAHTITVTSGNLTTGGILVSSAITTQAQTITGGNLMSAGAGKDLVLIVNSTTGGLGIGSTIINNTSATGLTKSGTGLLTLTGANTYNGTTYLNAGTLNLGRAETAGTSGPLGASAASNPGSIVLNGGTLQYSAANQNDYSGRFSTASNQFYNVDTNGQAVAWATALTSAGGSLTKSGAGTLTLSGTNTYTGTTTVSAGVLSIQNAAALGTTAAGTSVTSGASLQLQGNIAVGAEALALNGSGISNDGALRNISGSNAYGGNITLGSATRISSDSGTLTLNGTAAITGAGIGLTVGGAGNTTITSAIGTTTGTLTKDGTGTLALAGNNTYTGATNVTAGTLLVNGNQTSATGAVTVAPGATLGGNGTLGGATTIAGIVSPGDGGIGTLNITGNVTWQGASSNGTATDWIFQLGASPTSDLLNISGNFTKDATTYGSNFRFNFEGATNTGTFKVVDWSGTSSFIASDFSYTNLGSGLTGSFSIIDSQLDFSVLPAVPEPSTWVAMAALAITGGIMAMRRRDNLKT
jgi:autotransporter-associated beta strand protein